MENGFLTGQVLAGYAAHLQSEERSRATIEKYLRDVRAFAGWLGDRPIAKEACAAWKAQQIESGQAPATVNAKLSALNGLLRFLGREDCRVRFLKLQRQPFRDSSRELTREEYGRLVETAEKQGSRRLALLIETICATGIRVSEVRYITVQAARTGRAVISLKGKIRIILLPHRLCRKLLRFAGKQKIDSGEIFCAKGGKGLSRYQIWKQMKLLCVEAEVMPSKVFPHNLRHLFAAAFYQSTRDIVQLADLLGHSSVNTTRIYLLTSGEEHLRQLERLGLVT